MRSSSPKRQRAPGKSGGLFSHVSSSGRIDHRPKYIERGDDPDQGLVFHHERPVDSPPQEEAGQFAERCFRTNMKIGRRHDAPHVVSVEVALGRPVGGGTHPSPHKVRVLEILERVPLLLPIAVGYFFNSLLGQPQNANLRRSHTPSGSLEPEQVAGSSRMLYSRAVVAT